MKSHHTFAPGRWMILCIDARRPGQPIKALARRGGGGRWFTGVFESAMFFAQRSVAEDWMKVMATQRPGINFRVEEAGDVVPRRTVKKRKKSQESTNPQMVMF